MDYGKVITEASQFRYTQVNEICKTGHSRYNLAEKHKITGHEYQYRNKAEIEEITLL